jgi:hypothetical protein
MAHGSPWAAPKAEADEAYVHCPLALSLAFSNIAPDPLKDKEPGLMPKVLGEVSWVRSCQRGVEHLLMS